MVIASAHATLMGGLGCQGQSPWNQGGFLTRCLLRIHLLSHSPGHMHMAVIQHCQHWVLVSHFPVEFSIIFLVGFLQLEKRRDNCTRNCGVPTKSCANQQPVWKHKTLHFTSETTVKGHWILLLSLPYAPHKIFRDIKRGFIFTCLHVVNNYSPNNSLWQTILWTYFFSCKHKTSMFVINLRVPLGKCFLNMLT